MNLISCQQCGVVLDKNHTPFPDIYDHDTGSLLDGQSEWDGDRFVAIIHCPVCEGVIRDEQSNLS